MNEGRPREGPPRFRCRPRRDRLLVGRVWGREWTVVGGRAAGYNSPCPKARDPTAMNEDAFLASLREDPADELTWQALADFLDDSGQPDRAELLRLTRRMLPTPVSERGDVPRRYEELLGAG